MKIRFKGTFDAAYSTGTIEAIRYNLSERKPYRHVNTVRNIGHCRDVEDCPKSDISLAATATSSETVV